MDISSSAKINVGPGTFTLGTKRNRKSRLETRLLLDPKATLNISGGGYVGSGADIQLFTGAELNIGKGCCFNSGLEIVCAEKITFGEDVHIGRDVHIRDNNGEHYIIQPGYTWKAPVSIGAHCWIGSSVSIMKGVTIGEGRVRLFRRTRLSRIRFSRIALHPAIRRKLSLGTSFGDRKLELDEREQ